VLTACIIEQAVGEKDTSHFLDPRIRANAVPVIDEQDELVGIVTGV
jgi:hypothetical protein